MAVTVAQVQAVLTANTTQFDAGMKKADKTVKDFAEKSKDRLESVQKAMQALGQAMTLGLTAPLVALGKASVDAATRMDSLKRGLTAVAGSSEEAAKQLARLKEVAKLPGLGFEEAIQGSIRLQAAGFSAKQAEASLRAFGNALATVGKGKAELDGVSLALSQIASKGKVLAEEINQIAERVPQVREIMKKAFGTADTEILQQAKITSTEFVEIITNELNKLPQVTGGLKNSFENARDSINQSLTRIGDAIAPIVAMILDKVVPAIESMTKAFSELPTETKNLAIAIGALTIAGGPLLLITAQIIELGKAIGMARLAALGPVAGIAAVIGVGAVAGLSAWNADSDRKIAAGGTTAIQDLEAKLEAYKNDKSPRTPEGEAQIGQVKRALRNLYTAQARRDAIADGRAEIDGLQQQVAAEQKLADARKRVQDAMNEKARKEAEKAAKKAEAEAERLRKLNQGIRDDYRRLTDERYEYERFKAKEDYAESLREGANKAMAYNLYLMKIKTATIDMIEEVGKRIKQSEFPIPGFMKANRPGVDSITRNQNPAGDVSIEIPDTPFIRRDTQLGRPDRRRAIITDPAGNRADAQAEAFAQDMVRSARRASRNFLQALFGSDRDRRGIVAGLVDDLKKSLIDSFFNLNLNLTPLFQNLGKTLQSGLVSAVNAAIHVAQTGIGQMLGAVYQLIAGMSRKGGINVGSVLGAGLGFALGGPSGAAFGFNAGGALASGDVGGALASTALYAANGGFGGKKPWEYGDDPRGRSRSVAVNYNGPVTINNAADLDDLSRATVRRLELSVAAG
jgi:tape measure domain-containing protein